MVRGSRRAEAEAETTSELQEIFAMSHHNHHHHHDSPASAPKSERGSPKILRKRPQSVSLARVLVYDGGGETSSSNNSLNSSTSETGGGGRLGGRQHHPHLQGHVAAGAAAAAAAATEEEAAFRKLNLGSSTPIFGSVGGRAQHQHHHRHHQHQPHHQFHHHPHHSSLTIPSRGSFSIDAASSLSETNLIRVRSSALGKSAPALSQAMVSLGEFIG